MPDRFTGLGCFPGTVELELKENAEPVIHTPQRCPIHLKSEIQSELDKMEQQGIIERIPQGQPTEWLSSLAYPRKKDGTLRVCLDQRDLNQAIKPQKMLHKRNQHLFLRNDLQCEKC
jgi:hypothetical protein